MNTALIVLTALLPAAAPAQAPYRAGAAKVDITPAHPIRLNGFGFRRTESEGVYQKIHARALAIDDGKAPCVLLTVDVLGIPADVYDELAKRLEKKAGLKRGRLAVAATHTHTGPMLAGANPTIFGTPIPKEHLANIDRYTPVFIDKLEEAALAALKDLKPAKLEWGVGSVTFAVNRRKREVAPTDHDLPVLFVKDEKGKVRAVYLSYACHCVTLSHNKVGGDWAGFAASAVEDNFEGAVALVSIGGGADQNPSSGVTGAKEDIATAQGREVAAEVRRLSKNFLSPVAGAITAKVEALELPLAAMPTQQQWEEKAKRMDAIGHHARVTLAKIARGEKLPTKVSYPVQTWAFGDSLAMVYLPGEVVVDYPLRLKKELDGRRLWVTGYANNAPCYIPSERVLKEGGYEGGGAMIYYDLPAAFAPGLEDKIVGAVKAQIGKSFAPKFEPKKTGGELPKSPQQSQLLIKTKPGLKVDLVAAEPLVADPVALAFGPDGKLWVAEMADYPSGRTGKFDPGGRVVALEDADGDGTFDKSTVFLDGLPFPTGVLPWRKGVLVCAAPDILYAEDTDGDGKADKVEKLYSGFGTENYQARVNSLQYGLDGWVYGSCGLFGGNILCHKTGKTVALGNRDFRIKPDTGELEPATGRTQQGRVRDDRGNWFGCDNSNLVWHHVLDDHYLRRNPFVAFPAATVNVAPSRQLFSLKADAQRFALSGPPNTVTAACGIGIYRDDLLGKDFSGNAFTCEPVNLLVTRRVLKPKGSTFEGLRAPDEQDREFLASTDNWFRPVHVLTGPDGGLYVADMYRYLIEHPRWVPPADLAKIDARAGAGLGRIYRVRPADKPLRKWERLDKLDMKGLVAALDSPNGWQRDMAMMLLVWKNDPAAKEPLEKLVRRSKNGLARMQALCTLGLAGEVSRELLRGGIDDPDPGVRRHTIRLSEQRVKVEPGEELFGVEEWNRRDSDLGPHVWLQFAYSLGAAGSGDKLLGSKLARLMFDTPADPYLVAAATSSLHKGNVREVGAAVARLLETDYAFSPRPEPMRDFLASVAGVDNGADLPGVLAAVTTVGENGRYQVWQLGAVLGALDALERQGKPWGKLAPEVRKSVEPVLAYARKLSEKEDAAAADLLAAIPLLGRDPASRADDLRRLATMLAATRPAAVQSAAVAALARTPDKAASAALVGAWGSASPALRERILDSLLGRPAWQKELLAAVQKGTIPAGQIDAARRQRLTGSADDAVRAQAAKLFAGGNPDRQKVIDDYQAALALKGDKERGKAVFAKSCSACHLLDGFGHAVGPDLAALSNKSPLYLLSEILDPSRNLDSRYSEYQAVTKDERTVSGVLAAETATSITLRGQQAKEETILRTDLQSLRGTSKSLMPEGLEKDVAKQDMADLLAYLTAHEPQPKKLRGNTPAEIVVSDGALSLPATRCFAYGGDLTLETQYQNIGMWHGRHDYVAWKVRLDKAAEFDVYLDYACANDSAGNTFALEGAEPALRGKVAGTGGWGRYTLVKLGTVKLSAGAGKITFRPDGPLKGALLDLRTLYLVPVGTKPNLPEARGRPQPPTELASLILSDSTPKDRRESLSRLAAAQAGPVVRAMTADLKPGDAKEEYRRIPWVWRVAVAAGRADDAKALAGLLDASLPKKGEGLHDWQAVALGGGIVNGLGLEGKWPGKRLAELTRDSADLQARWAGALKRAHALADDGKTPTGTRYDALRIVALDDWRRAGPRLAKYLAKGTNAELQQGAVSGLVDAEDAGATALLVNALPDLAPGNRAFAVAGLLRTAARAAALLDAVEKGGAKAEWLSSAHRDALLKHADAAVRTRAARLLGGG